MGRLVNDPELKMTTNTIEYCDFTVAVNRSRDKEKADFIDVQAWRHHARFISQYFRKGSMIAIQGHIETDSYTDKNGNKRKSVKIVVDEASFCGSKSEQGGSSAPPNLSVSPPGDGEGDFHEIPEEDLPF